MNLSKLNFAFGNYIPCSKSVLTLLTVVACSALRTYTHVAFDAVDASGTRLTWIAGAFIDVCIQHKYN